MPLVSQASRIFPASERKKRRKTEKCVFSLLNFPFSSVLFRSLAGKNTAGLREYFAASARLSMLQYTALFSAGGLSKYLLARMAKLYEVPVSKHDDLPLFIFRGKQKHLDLRPERAMDVFLQLESVLSSFITSLCSF